MKYKILIHAPNLSTPGGKQTYFASLKDHFKNDIDFFFYGSQGKKESFLKMPFRVLRDYYKFYRLLRTNDYDLVHLNPSLNPKSFFRDSVFALICSLAKVKMTVFWHGWQWGFEKKVVARIVPWFRASYGRADSMIILGKEFGDQLKTYGFKNSIYQVTTVADPIFFKPENRIVHYSEGATPQNKLKVLFLSRIERVKGVYETIEAFESLKLHNPNIKLTIAGTGSELEAVKNHIKNKSINDIEFLGWITGDKKVEAFNTSDIYLLPSYHGEGLPCSILEAMAIGLPIITTNVGGIKDFFEEGIMGYLVKMKDSDDISHKLQLLINTPENMKTMGKYNLNYAEKRFTPEQVGARLEDIYSRTIVPE